MSHTINGMREDVTDLKHKVDGDGNSVKGLVRRADNIEGRQDNIERAMAKVDKLFWAILTAIILGVVLQSLRATYGPAPAQHVSQSVSSGTNTDDPPAPTYTTPQLASLLHLSEREIQDRAMRGEIPSAYKDGKAWRFSRAKVDAWIAASAENAASAANAEPANQN